PPRPIAIILWLIATAYAAGIAFFVTCTVTFFSTFSLYGGPDYRPELYGAVAAAIVAAIVIAIWLGRVIRHKKPMTRTDDPATLNSDTSRPSP
ncbi:MAG: hypothetical protein KDA41_18545, partial [Planctomycetales bacterium]|nr:hypothetical protein [Planctomycetales bacterium]